MNGLSRERGSRMFTFFFSPLPNVTDGKEMKENLLKTLGCVWKHIASSLMAAH